MRNLNKYLIIVFALVLYTALTWLGLNYVILPIFGEIRFQFLEVFVAATILRITYKSVIFDDVVENKLLLEENNKLLSELKEITLKSAINSMIYYNNELTANKSNHSVSLASESDDKSGID